MPTMNAISRGISNAAPCGAFALGLLGIAAGALPAAAAETVVASMELTTDLPPAAKVMTMVVDVPAGTEFPLHSHGGPGVATLLSGELDITFADGSIRHMMPGEVFVEDAGMVHGAKVGAEPVRFVWTLVLPDDAEMETPYAE